MEPAPAAPPVGAMLRDAPTGRCRFRVWAPAHARLSLILDPDGTAPRRVAFCPEADGYHCVEVDGVAPGARYVFEADGERRPDPASLSQPDGVHAPSAVVSLSFPWTDEGFAAPPLERAVFYELHVGAFTPQGTLDAAIEHLDALVDLGVTVVELMPVAQFPGARNWGYDGVYPFAVQSTYGGPRALMRFVDAAHARGLAVALDVVYNHLGPEGNYLGWYAPDFFTDRYRTPWGDAVNLDGPGSDAVRGFLLQNALHWFEHFHVDVLRLDAVHALHDRAAMPFLEELAAAVEVRSAVLERPLYLVAESDANDARLITAQSQGGMGLHAVWADDLHHALHRQLTGETQGYYVDYPDLSHLADALRDGFAYTGQHSPFRGRRHGRPPGGLASSQFVVCCQNHDQVGNRMRGERLSALVDLERLKLAAFTVLLGPHVPLLFMGEEYGETAPFPYVVDHGDAELLEAVRAGRAAEFDHPVGAADGPPDPAHPETFASAVLDHGLRRHPAHAALRALYRHLIHLRRDAAALQHPDRARHRVTHQATPPVVLSHRWFGDAHALLALHFGPTRATMTASLPAGTWRRRLDTADPRWAGPGGAGPESLTTTPTRPEAELTLAPWSAALYLSMGPRSDAP